MKHVTLVEIAMLIIHHQGTEKILTGRSSFSVKRVKKLFLSSYLYAIYPQNETLSLVDPVPPKARILEVWVLVTSPESVVKNFGPLVCVWRVVVLGQSILT
jgi:hypothetical protein